MALLDRDGYLILNVRWRVEGRLLICCNYSAKKYLCLTRAPV